MKQIGYWPLIGDTFVSFDINKMAVTCTLTDSVHNKINFNGNVFFFVTKRAVTQNSIKTNPVLNEKLYIPSLLITHQIVVSFPKCNQQYLKLNSSLKRPNLKIYSKLSNIQCLTR